VLGLELWIWICDGGAGGAGEVWLLFAFGDRLVAGRLVDEVDVGCYWEERIEVGEDGVHFGGGEFWGRCEGCERWGYVGGDEMSMVRIRSSQGQMEEVVGGGWRW